jgi:hypothetical protein
MKKNRQGAVLKAKKGLEGFFTPEEANALNRNIREAAGALGIPGVDPFPAEAFRTAPSHANGVHASGEIHPPRRSHGSF